MAQHSQRLSVSSVTIARMASINIEGVRKPNANLYPVDVGFRCVEVIIPDHEGYLWILAAFVAILGNDWSWLGTKPERQSHAQLWKTAYAMTLWDLCMQCEDLQECLQPFFDAIQARFDALDIAIEAINTTTQQIRETQEEQSAKPPPTLPPTPATSATYAGALALVKQMNTNNLKYYDEAEGSFVDNASEALSIVLELFPEFKDQSYDEAFELGNSYFENQVLAYEADYPDMEVPAACDLMCRIEANGNVLDVDVWGDWLFELPDTVPDNAAANVFTRYSPLRQTFLNQIAALFNQEQSLQSYFEELWQVYYAGTKTPVPVPPECSCPVRVDVGATVNAPPGVDSYFDVVSGQDYEFSAFGTWKGGTGVSYDADGNVGTLEPLAIAPTVAVYALVYRITDTGTWLLSGVSNTFTAPESGRVYFAMNDVTGAYGDNEGTITVELVAL